MATNPKHSGSTHVKHKFICGQDKHYLDKHLPTTSLQPRKDRHTNKIIAGWPSVKSGLLSNMAGS
jgi:hypothetical protein